MHLEIHSKKPGFTVEMLIIPSQETTKQSFFSALFFGKENTTTEIPISNYNITDTALEITPYSEGDIPKLQKTYALSVYLLKAATMALLPFSFVHRLNLVSMDSSKQEKAVA